MAEAHPEIDLANPDSYVDAVPYEQFDHLRHEHPVFWHPERPPNKGFWAVTRYDDLTAVHMDWDTYSSEVGAVALEELDEEQLEIRKSMLETDPPRHTQLRAVCSKRFRAGRWQVRGVDPRRRPRRPGPGAPEGRVRLRP
jgi:cytochrome P450